MRDLSTDATGWTDNGRYVLSPGRDSMFLLRTLFRFVKFLIHYSLFNILMFSSAVWGYDLVFCRFEVTLDALPRVMNFAGLLRFPLVPPTVTSKDFLQRKLLRTKQDFAQMLPRRSAFWGYRVPGCSPSQAPKLLLS